MNVDAMNTNAMTQYVQADSEGCCAGDSLFAPLDSVTVHKRSVEEGEECSQDLTYLRLLLPMQYVLDDIQDPQLVQECILSAIEVRFRPCSRKLLWCKVVATEVLRLLQVVLCFCASLSFCTTMVHRYEL